MQNIVTLGEINDALKFTTVTAAQLAEMGFAALANKPICEALPQEEARRLRTAKLYPAESIGQIRVALAKRLAAPASCLHQIQEPAPVQADARAAELLRFLQDQCIDLRCFTTSDGEDVGWRTVQHHMSEPRERVVSEVYGDQPRRAIREAMARIERDPYCTGPLHLEDDAAIAAAKGE